MIVHFFSRCSLFGFSLTARPPKMSFFKRFRGGKKRNDQQLHTIKETPDLHGNQDVTTKNQDAVQPGDKPSDVTSQSGNGGQPTFDINILVTEMVQAASRGDTTSIEMIHLQNPTIVNMKCPDGHTALHVAAENGDLNTVQCLVKIGSSSDVKDNFGVTPIMKAVMRNHVQIVAYLLEMTPGAPQSWSALHIASLRGNLDVLRCLLNGGCSSDTQTPQRVTPIMIAAECGHVECVRLLVSKGANCEMYNADGWTALHYAVAKNHLDVLQLLLENRVPVDIPTRKEQYTPLHLAAQNGHERVLRVLIESWADVNKQTKLGLTALRIAAENRRKEAVRFLSGTEANHDIRDMKGWNLLHYAAFRNMAPIVQHLLKMRKAKVDVPNNEGVTPLHLTAQEGHRDVMEILLNAGADPDIQTFSRHSPVMQACWAGHLDCVKLLHAKGAELGDTDMDGCTPLHFATVRKQLNIVKYLLDSGVDVNAAQCDGHTALHIAADTGDDDIIATLLNHPSTDINRQNHDGLTAFQIAQQKEHREDGEDEHVVDEEMQIETQEAIAADNNDLTDKENRDITLHPADASGEIQRNSENDIAEFLAGAMLLGAHAEPSDAPDTDNVAEDVVMANDDEKTVVGNDVLNDEQDGVSKDVDQRFEEHDEPPASEGMGIQHDHDRETAAEVDNSMYIGSHVPTSPSSVDAPPHDEKTKKELEEPFEGVDENTDVDVVNQEETVHVTNFLDDASSVPPTTSTEETLETEQHLEREMTGHGRDAFSTSTPLSERPPKPPRDLQTDFSLGDEVLEADNGKAVDVDKRIDDNVAIEEAAYGHAEQVQFPIDIAARYAAIARTPAKTVLDTDQPVNEGNVRNSSEVQLPSETSSIDTSKTPRSDDATNDDRHDSRLGNGDQGPNSGVDDNREHSDNTFNDEEGQRLTIDIDARYAEIARLPAQGRRSPEFDSEPDVVDLFETFPTDVKTDVGPPKPPRGKSVDEGVTDALLAHERETMEVDSESEYEVGEGVNDAGTSDDDKERKILADADTHHDLARTQGECIPDVEEEQRKEATDSTDTKFATPVRRSPTTPPPLCTPEAAGSEAHDDEFSVDDVQKSDSDIDVDDDGSNALLSPSSNAHGRNRTSRAETDDGFQSEWNAIDALLSKSLSDLTETEVDSKKSPENSTFPSEQYGNMMDDSTGTLVFPSMTKDLRRIPAELESVEL